MDMGSNDPIGSGDCSAGKACELESCTVTLSGSKGLKGAVAVTGQGADGGGLGVGSRVSCDWKSGGVFYNGTITKKNGDQVHISYDDGDQEDTVISKCRPLGGDKKAAYGKGALLSLQRLQLRTPGVRRLPRLPRRPVRQHLSG